MKILEVIPSKRWRNTVNNRTASLYGAAPWTSDKERSNWILECVGYTWRLDNGTIGLGRMPAKTELEALEVMERFNNK